MRNLKKTIALILMVSLALCAFAGCSGSSNAQEGTITIIDGSFAEMNLFTQVARIMIEEHTDLEVKVNDAMANTLAFEEIKKGSMDIFMSYDGSLLATYLQSDVSEVPEGETLYDYVVEKAKREANVLMLDQLGHENTYAIAVKQELADRYNLETISDLREYSGDLVFATEHEFFDEEGTIRFIPFCAYYDIEFKESKQILLDLKYTGIDSGNMDVTMVYGSDGLNKKSDLKILTDDLKFFPDYHGAYIVRGDLFEDYPELEAVFAKLAGQFSLETCIDLNYQIDVEERDPYEVAYEYLSGKGLI